MRWRHIDKKCGYSWFCLLVDDLLGIASTTGWCRILFSVYSNEKPVAIQCRSQIAAHISTPSHCRRTQPSISRIDLCPSTRVNVRNSSSSWILQNNSPRMAAKKLCLLHYKRNTSSPIIGRFHRRQTLQHQYWMIFLSSTYQLNPIRLFTARPIFAREGIDDFASLLP